MKKTSEASMKIAGSVIKAEIGRIVSKNSDGSVFQIMSIRFFAGGSLIVTKNLVSYLTSGRLITNS